MFIITRSESNPIISPTKERPWEATATFNWCPVKDGKTIHVVYRAMGDKELLKEPRIRTSIIAKATSTSGEKFVGRVPFIVPEEDFEKFGCEDPRVTRLDGKYYIFYTALSTYPFSADGIKVALAISDDMETIRERHLITPFNAKAMVLFPEKIGGKMGAILSVDTDHPPSRIAYIEFNKPEDMWSEEYWKKWRADLDSHTIPLRRRDDDQVEVGAPPIKTKHGWLVIYSYISHYLSGRPTFGIEAVLLDLKNPRMIIGRTKGTFMVPEMYYETTGFMPEIVFPSGALVSGDKLDIYYGAADTHCAKASVSLENLVESMLPKPKNGFKRFSGNPLLSARKGKEWEAGGVLNPGAIEINKKIHLLYRAASKENVSTLGFALLKDGTHIDERSANPVYVARTDFEGKSRGDRAGCEDPRLVEIDEKIYMTYTAYDGNTPRVAVSSISKNNFTNKKWNMWSPPEVISDPNIPNKDACIIPEKFDDGYVLLHRIENTICADILPDLDFSKRKINRCIEMISPRKGMWDSRKVGIAAPPIKTKAGWLLLYHGISNSTTYRVGAILLDLKNPIIVKARTATPIFEPKENYELNGVMPKVVFPCGIVRRGNTLYMYYGAADSTVCLATAKLSDILDMLSES